MGNAHQMIVHNVGKVIGRITIGFNKNHIVQFGIIHRNIAINFVTECCCPFGRIVLTDNIRNSGCQLFFNFFFGKAQTVFVINHNLFSRHFLFQAVQTLFITETIISFTFFNKLFCIFHINACCLTFALNIRTAAAVFIRSLIMDQACFFQRPVNNIHCAFYKAFLVCIFNS